MDESQGAVSWAAPAQQRPYKTSCQGTGGCWPAQEGKAGLVWGTNSVTVGLGPRRGGRQGCAYGP